MPVPPPSDTIVDLETAWLAGDATVVALAKPTAYLRKRADGAKGLDVWVSRTVERRISAGRVERAHMFQLQITWPLVAGGASMVLDQRYLDTLIDALLVRIRGTEADHTHGGLFLSCGQPDDGPDGGGGSPQVLRSDPLSALNADLPVLTATVSYGATEQLITN